MIFTLTFFGLVFSCFSIFSFFHHSVFESWFGYASFFCFIAAYFLPTLSNHILFSHFLLRKWRNFVFWWNMNIALLFSGVAGYGEEKGGENRDFVHSCNIGNFGGFK